MFPVIEGMQTSTAEKKSETSIVTPSNGKTETNGTTIMPSRGAIIKVGLITGGALAAGITLAYYLKKRSS